MSIIRQAFPPLPFMPGRSRTRSPARAPLLSIKRLPMRFAIPTTPQPFSAEGVWKHLYPHYEPHPGGARRACRRARRRYRCPCGGLRPRGAIACLFTRFYNPVTISLPHANSMALDQSFRAFLPELRLASALADAADPVNFESQIDERTKAIFIESLANPGAHSSISRLLPRWRTGMACR